MKGDTVFKKTFNLALDHLASLRFRDSLDSESLLKDKFEASRTTVRKVLRELEDRQVIVSRQHKRMIARRPRKADYFPRAETVSTSARVEKMFMEWMLRGDRKPGDFINGLELTREFGVSTSAVREYLNRFSRFGLIEKRPNSGWIFRGFTREFALELFEVRELFETRSAIAFATQPREAAAWKTLHALEREHRDLLKKMATRYHDFSDLDERFHRLVIDASNNRFMVDFHDVISLIFHYHYQWNKSDEKKRNRVAILEHLEYMEALFSRDPGRIELACKSHLKSARNSLLASVV
jgi:DNA-binding GntR family transcriptional regulator